MAPPQQGQPNQPTAPSVPAPAQPSQPTQPVSAPQSPVSPIQEQHAPSQGVVKGESEQSGQAPSGTGAIPVSGQTQAGTVAGASTQGAQQGSAGSLPFTGVNSVLLLVLGLMALGLGAGLRKVVRAER